MIKAFELRYNSDEYSLMESVLDDNIDGPCSLSDISTTEWNEIKDMASELLEFFDKYVKK